MTPRELIEYLQDHIKLGDLNPNKHIAISNNINHTIGDVQRLDEDIHLFISPDRNTLYFLYNPED